MYLVEIIPLIRGSAVGTLSYYSSQNLAIGTLVNTPIRSTMVNGLVSNCQPVSTAKAALRAATFSLKKLPLQVESNRVPDSVIATATELATVYPAQTGAILHALLPPDVRAGVRPYPPYEVTERSGDTTPSVLTGMRKDRYITYRSLIRQTFARRGSTLFIVPTSVHVERAKAALAQGIERRIITFSSTSTKKQLDVAYHQLGDLTESKLIITTPSYALLERVDCTSIIIDESGSPYYRSRTRPYLDARDVLKRYAKISNRSLVLGDLLVTTEDEFRRREDIYQTVDEHVQRLNFPTPLLVLEKDLTVKPEKRFSIIQPDTKAAIARTVAQKGRVFLYAARQGLAPAIVCYDCGYLFRCPESGSPYSLIRTYEDDTERRWFISSTSGKRIRASDTCPDCGSWRLREQGYGVQQVLDEVQALFPHTPITLFDSTTASTRRKANTLIQQFTSTKGGILVGTAMVLPYLPDLIDLTVITSYAAARSVNTWRAEEAVLSLILTLREHTNKECIIQTRTAADGLLKIAQKGLTDTFYGEAIELREQLGYPPFSTFILLTITGNKEQVVAGEAVIDAGLPHHAITYYSAPHSTPEKITRYGLLRIPKSNWPDTELMDALRALPPYIKIEVDPDRIV
jgi:primosomal protein N' (replication factor Y) (superfamily II helicase)